MVYAMNRKAVSATAATIFGVIAIIIGMLIFSYLAVGIVRSFQASSGIVGGYAEESKAVLRAYAVLDIEKSGNTILNKTYLVFENLVPDEVAVDHIAITSKSGAIISDKSLQIKLKPGESVQLKPSEIDQALAVYDGDFWRFKKEIGYFEIHVEVGGVGSSFKSIPVFRMGSNPIEIVTTSIGGATTTTATTTITRTETSWETSTYTSTIRVTTTCTKTTCRQQDYVTEYIVVTSRVPQTTLTVTKTVFTDTWICRTIRTITYYSTYYATVTRTEVISSLLGRVTCSCGQCPTGVYYVPRTSENSQSLAIYMLAPLFALAVAPEHFKLDRRRLALAIIILILATVLITPNMGSAQTITVTVTGTNPTTETTTITTTSTTTITSTTTTTVTSTVTVTTTSLVTEYRCSGVASTITVTERTITISTSTKYTRCWQWTEWVTTTLVSIVTHRVDTFATYVNYYWVICR